MKNPKMSNLKFRDPGLSLVPHYYQVLESDPSLFLGPCPWLMLEHAPACVLDELVDGV